MEKRWVMQDVLDEIHSINPWCEILRMGRIDLQRVGLARVARSKTLDWQPLDGGWI